MVRSEFPRLGHLPLPREHCAGQVTGCAKDDWKVSEQRIRGYCVKLSRHENADTLGVFLVSTKWGFGAPSQVKSDAANVNNPMFWGGRNSVQGMQ